MTYNGWKGSKPGSNFDVLSRSDFPRALGSVISITFIYNTFRPMSRTCVYSRQVDEYTVYSRLTYARIVKPTW